MPSFAAVPTVIYQHAVSDTVVLASFQALDRHVDLNPSVEGHRPGLGMYVGTAAYCKLYDSGMHS